MERAVPGHRWPTVVMALGAISGGCLALVALRVARTREMDFAFLSWNLALAWTPFVLAILLYRGYHRRAPRPMVALTGLFWLLFLPNAPYITTDFVHLQWSAGMPFWFDALTVSAYAVTGLLLGFASLYLVQAVAAEQFGDRAIWLLVVVVLWLSSVGIYLGRYQRLNSWDAVRHPRLLVSMVRTRVHEPLGNMTLLAVMVLFTAFLTVLYLILYVMVTQLLPRLDAERARPHRTSR